MATRTKPEGGALAAVVERLVTDAVKVIRGKKGTEVKLTVKKQDGSLKVISLIRDEIVQDETFARSAIVKEGGSRIGYIYLPEFYADFDRTNGARCSDDVAKEIKKLKLATTYRGKNHKNQLTYSFYYTYLLISNSMVRLSHEHSKEQNG